MEEHSHLDREIMRESQFECRDLSDIIVWNEHYFCFNSSIPSSSLFTEQIVRTGWTSECTSSPLFSFINFTKYHNCCILSYLIFSCLSCFSTSYIFPGVGLGCIVSKALTVTDEDMYIAAVTLASCVTQSQLDIGNAYPPLSTIRDVRCQNIDISHCLLQ